MSEIEKYLDGMLEANEHFEKGMAVFRGGPATFVIKEIVNCQRSMFERFCPFSIGDRVQLSKTPNLDKSPAWASSKHFLIKGAAATIKDRGYSGDLFTFSLEFDDESWIDNDGKEHFIVRPRSKHLYSFPENMITKEDN